MTTRADIIAEARSWIGTAYHHQGRLKRQGKKRGGVDCIGLVLSVADNCGLVSTHTDKSGNFRRLTDFDRADYSPSPTGLRLWETLERFLAPIAMEEATEGDVVLFRITRHPQHVAILSRLPDGAPGMIHCYAGVGRVIEHTFDDRWRARALAAYRFHGVEER